MPWVTPRTWVTGELETTTVFNQHVRDNLAWLYSGESGWTLVADGGMSNGWLNYDTTTFGPCRYKKVGPFVEMVGLVRNGTLGNHCFTLPAGYRPGLHLIWGADSAVATGAGGANGGNEAELRVHKDGTVVPTSSGIAGATVYFSICCRFLQEL